MSKDKEVFTPTPEKEEEMKELAIAVVLSMVTSFSYAFDLPLHDKQVVKINRTDGGFIATGFYAGKKYVMTNAHVVKHMHPISIKTPQGTLVGEHMVTHQVVEVEDVKGGKRLGSVVYIDEDTDVAMIRLIKVGKVLRPVKFATEPVKRGDKIFSLGHPAGIGWSFAQGYVANAKAYGDKPGSERILVDSLGFFGASGSPLYNADGEVVGMLSGIFRQGSGIIVIPAKYFAGLQE